jgi:hypothetical protein
MTAMKAGGGAVGCGCGLSLVALLLVLGVATVMFIRFSSSGVF